jgi:hypothetical protein
MAMDKKAFQTLKECFPFLIEISSSTDKTASKKSIDIV